MFDTPEYASYIELCRELRLEHIFAREDLLAVQEPAGELRSEVAGSAFCNISADEELIWLPRLDQWLAMLEEAGRREIHLADEIAGPNRKVNPWAIWSGPEEGYGSTREEAAARLWIAVVDEIAQREGVTSY